LISFLEKQRNGRCHIAFGTAKIVAKGENLQSLGV